MRRRGVCTLKIVGDVPVTKVIVTPKKQHAAAHQQLLSLIGRLYLERCEAACSVDFLHLKIVYSSTS